MGGNLQVFPYKSGFSKKTTYLYNKDINMPVLTMSYKKEINTFIEQRYDYLLECSKNILKKNNRGIDPTELVSELVIHLHTNRDKIEDYIRLNKLEAFCVSWMNIQGKYYTSPLNIKYTIRAYEMDDYTKETYGEIDETIEVIDKNEYEQDLLQHFTEDQVEKIMLVDKIYPSLTKSEQILFDAYFIKNLSYDKIVERYTFYRDKDGKRVTYKSKKSIYNLMIGLREKITDLLKKEEDGDK